MQYFKYFKGYNVKCVPAIRNNRVARASGGMMCGIKNTLDNRIKFKKCENNIIIDIVYGTKHFKILPVYLNYNEWHLKYNKLYNFLVTHNYENIMIMGNLNGRTRDFQNSILMNNCRFSNERKSSDNYLNHYGKLLVGLIEVFGFFVLNGTSYNDSEDSSLLRVAL